MELTIEITNTCMNQCIHCSSDSKENGNYMNIGAIEKCLEEISPDKVILSGGEPFLHPEIGKIITMIKKHSILAVNTSGIFKNCLLPSNVSMIDEFYISYFLERNELIGSDDSYFPLSKIIFIEREKQKVWINTVMMFPEQIIEIPFAAYYCKLPVHIMKLVLHGRASNIFKPLDALEQRGMALYTMNQLNPDNISNKIPLFLRHDGYRTEIEFSTIKEECFSILNEIYPRCRISHSLIDGKCHAKEKRTLLLDGRLIGCVSGKDRDETIGKIKACC